MVDDVPAGHRITVGADKAYDTKDFVADLRSREATPHVTQNDKVRRSAIDGRTTRHPGYAISQRKRKRIEEVFGWIKSSAGLRKTRHCGTARVGWIFTLNAAGLQLGATAQAAGYCGLATGGVCTEPVIRCETQRTSTSTGQRRTK